MHRVLLSWSSGKDSAWTLHVLRQQPDVEVVGLVTTFNEAAGRVAMHAVRRELVEAQAEAANMPLWPVMLPWPCTNEAYEERMQALLKEAAGSGVTHMAFGDLFLEDIRAYRIRLLARTGIEPLFPIWCSSTETPALAKAMVAAGLRAILTCVDPKQLAADFAGCEYHELINEAGSPESKAPDPVLRLPVGVDPCGERGEFHTYCYAGPMFRSRIVVEVGERIRRDSFHYADVRLLANVSCPFTH
jgi:uncharacterized protein (TIGR00290 family)